MSSQDVVGWQDSRFSYRKHLVDSVLKAADSETFYWASGEKVPLQPDSTMFFLLFAPDKVSALQQYYTKIDDGTTDFGKVANYVSRSKEQENWLYECVKLRSSGYLPYLGDIHFKQNAYTTTDSDTLFCSEEVYVKLHDGVFHSELKAYESLLNVRVMRQLAWFDDWYELSCLRSSYTPLTVCNVLYNDSKVMSAVPGFFSLGLGTGIEARPLPAP